MRGEGQHLDPQSARNLARAKWNQKPDYHGIHGKGCALGAVYQDSRTADTLGGNVRENVEKK